MNQEPTTNLALLDKLQKLLALSESSNPHESELALSRAKEIALKHEIDLATLKDQPKNLSSDPIKVNWSLEVAPKQVQKYLTLILQKHFRVQVIYFSDYYTGNINSITLVGKKTDLEIATYVQVYLKREFIKHFESYMLSKGSKAPKSFYAESFYRGLWQGLDAKLTRLEKELLSSQSSQVQSNFALIRKSDKDKLQEEINKLFPNLTTTKSNWAQVNQHEAMLEGAKVGSSIDLNKALENKDSEVVNTKKLL